MDSWYFIFVGKGNKHPPPENSPVFIFLKYKNLSHQSDFIYSSENGIFALSKAQKIFNEDLKISFLYIPSYFNCNFAFKHFGA